MHSEDTFEVQLTCKNMDCHHSFIVGHMGVPADFKSLEKAIAYLHWIEKRDRINFRNVIGLPPDENTDEPLDALLMIECPKCRRLYRYHALEHFIQRIPHDI